MPASFRGVRRLIQPAQMAAKCAGTPKAMVSEYIARSLRPIALITAGPSAGFSSHILAHLGGVRASPCHDSRTTRRTVSIHEESAIPGRL
jgi:hypothetical protein